MTLLFQARREIKTLIDFANVVLDQTQKVAGLVDSMHEPHTSTRQERAVVCFLADMGLIPGVPVREDSPVTSDEMYATLEVSKLADCLRQGPAKVTSTVFYAAYGHYCKIKNLEPVSHKIFGGTANQYLKNRKINGRVIYFLTQKQSTEANT